MNEIEDFKKQHLDTYKNATKEIISNNTKSLVEGDILSLVKKPPLDSMEVIRTKMISLAKKDKIVLDSEELEKILDRYRKDVSKSILTLIEIRNNPLLEKIDLFSPSRETEIIKISKKDLDSINKNIKKKVKEIIKNSNEKVLFTKIDALYDNEDISKEFKKFMNSNYSRQLSDNIAIKILVKDQTLMSGVIEQGERYLFTKTNSHIFD